MSNQFLALKNKLPVLGVGLGLRREIAELAFENRESVDWLEIAPENYMRVGGAAAALLERACARFPVISHGLSLSIGSTDELNDDYLKALKSILDKINAPWASDHLCFASFGGVYAHDLLPIPFSKEAVKHVAKRLKYVQNYLERPFLLENTSYYTILPGTEMTEAQCLSEIAEVADCGILLDVNNVYVNAQNHGYDAKDFINQLPLERVVQMHVAGHKRRPDVIIDTHGAPVIEPVFELLEYALARTNCLGVMLERDQNFPEADELLAELKQIRQIWQKSKSPNLQNAQVKKNDKAATR